MKNVFLYALSTCGHCKNTKQFLKDKGILFDFIDVDLLEGEERERIIDEVKKLNPDLSFPTIIIGDCIIVGFKEKEILDALKDKEIGDHEVLNLYKTYQKILMDKYKGQIEFNKDIDLVFELLKGLLINKKRYGYTSCPCRLACGDREKDRDIICPCVYREKDIEEYGKCYCGLYVSPEYNKGLIQDVCVPERRKINL